MPALTERKKYTPEEYLALEEKAEYKSEYLDGYIFKMAGGTREHIRITTNVSRALENQLGDECEVFPSEMKVWIQSLGKFFYPDVTVVCDEIKFYKNRRDAVENPVLLVEVLSDSTKVYDKEDKFFAYQQVKSFQEYVLIHQDKPLVEQFIRQSDGGWKYFAYIGLQTTFRLESIEAQLKFSEIYNRISFEI